MSIMIIASLLNLIHTFMRYNVCACYTRFQFDAMPTLDALFRQD